MALDNDTRQSIASDLLWLTAIEIRALIRNACPQGSKERNFWGTQQSQAQNLRQEAERRMNVIVDGLQVKNVSASDFVRLVDELDQFIEGVPAEEIYGE